MEWVWSRKNDYMPKTKREIKKEVKRETEKEIIYSIKNKLDSEINKKEEHNLKLQGREAIIQRSVNPFMTHDYGRDLEIQNNFLIPKDSNQNN